MSAEPWSYRSFSSFFHWLPESSESNTLPSSSRTHWQTSCHTLPCCHFFFYRYFLLAPIFLHPWLFDIYLSDSQALICPIQLSTCIPWVFAAYPHLRNADAVAACPTLGDSCQPVCSDRSTTKSSQTPTSGPPSQLPILSGLRLRITLSWERWSEPSIPLEVQIRKHIVLCFQHDSC